MPTKEHHSLDIILSLFLLLMEGPQPFMLAIQQ